MSTSATIYIFNPNNEIICSIYKNWDGYVEKGLGDILVAMLKNTKLTLGVSPHTASKADIRNELFHKQDGLSSIESVNGMDELAILLAAKLKYWHPNGDVYMNSPTLPYDPYVDFIYIIKPTKDDKISLQVQNGRTIKHLLNPDVETSSINEELKQSDKHMLLFLVYLKNRMHVYVATTDISNIQKLLSNDSNLEIETILIETEYILANTTAEFNHNNKICPLLINTIPESSCYLFKTVMYNNRNMYKLYVISNDSKQAYETVQKSLMNKMDISEEELQEWEITKIERLATTDYFKTGIQSWEDKYSYLIIDKGE